MDLAAEDHVIHVTIANIVLFLLHRTILSDFDSPGQYMRASAKSCTKKGNGNKRRRRLSRPQTRNDLNRKFRRHRRGITIPAPFRACQSCHFLETGSLHPPLAALRRFPCASEKTPLSPQTCAPSARALPRAAIPLKKRLCHLFEVNIACREFPPRPPARRPCNGRRCEHPIP